MSSRKRTRTRTAAGYQGAPITCACATENCGDGRRKRREEPSTQMKRARPCTSSLTADTTVYAVAPECERRAASHSLVTARAVGRHARSCAVDPHAGLLSIHRVVTSCRARKNEKRGKKWRMHGGSPRLTSSSGMVARSPSHPLAQHNDTEHALTLLVGLVTHSSPPSEEERERLQVSSRM